MLDPLCIIVGECLSVQETQNEASLASDGGRQRGKGWTRTGAKRALVEPSRELVHSQRLARRESR